VEYAIEAIKLGSTGERGKQKKKCSDFYMRFYLAVGVKSSEGVVLAVEKRVTSPLMEVASIEKILEIDSHIGCAMSGKKVVCLCFVLTFVCVLCSRFSFGRFFYVIVLCFCRSCCRRENSGGSRAR
jgi:20S proteasome alpha/beta subunit